MKIFLETPNLVKIGQILDTLHGDLSVFYCYWLHKFTIKAFLCKLKYYFYIVDSDMEGNNTHRKHCCKNG